MTQPCRITGNDQVMGPPNFRALTYLGYFACTILGSINSFTFTFLSLDGFRLP